MLRFCSGPIDSVLIATPIMHASGLTCQLIPALLAGWTAVLLAPLGLALGAPFPAGLSAVSERAGTRIPWLWAVNSATSVLGSVLATLVSIHLGIAATLVACLPLVKSRVSSPPKAVKRTCVVMA